jgi:hypothetical protein
MSPELVILQWPAPDMRSFVPGDLALFSIKPLIFFLKLAAENKPEAPAPTIITSYIIIITLYHAIMHAFPPFEYNIKGDAFASP